jgi:hypothetical protein
MQKSAKNQGIAWRRVVLVVVLPATEIGNSLADKFLEGSMLVMQ